jgi:hypothetical protein
MDEPPVWTRHHDLFRASWPPQHIVWEGALRPIIGTDRLVDRRGIMLASEECLHRRWRYVLGWVMDMLSLRHTEGWRQGPPPFLKALTASFFAPFGVRGRGNRCEIGDS